MKAVLLLLLLPLCALPICNAQNLALENQLDFPNDAPVVLGEGWDVFRQKGTKSICIEFAETKENFVDVPLAVFSRATDKQTAFLALTASQKGELTLPIGKGSTSLDFSFTQDTSADSLIILIDGSANAAPSFAAPKRNEDGDYRVRLTDAALGYLQKGSDYFRQQCGDSYVSLIQRGARLIGRYEVRNASKADRINYDQSLTASTVKIGGAGASIEGKLSAELKRDQQRGRVTFFFKAYAASDEIGTDEPSFLKNLASLPSVARNYPRPLSMQIVAYNTAGNWPSDIAFLRTSPASTLSATALQLDSLLAILRGIQASPDFVKVFDTEPGRLRRLEDSMLMRRKQVAQALQQCEQGNECNDTSATGFSDYELRAQLPTQTRLADLSPNASVDVLIANLAADRWQQWIVDADMVRCRYRGPSECLSENERLRWLSQIENNIRASLQR